VSAPIQLAAVPDPRLIDLDRELAKGHVIEFASNFTGSSELSIRESTLTKSAASIPARVLSPPVSISGFGMR